MTEPTPAEIAAAIREYFDADARQEAATADLRASQAKLYALVPATELTDDDAFRAWLAGHDARQPEVDALRGELDDLGGRYATVREQRDEFNKQNASLRAELAALRSAGGKTTDTVTITPQRMAEERAAGRMSYTSAGALVPLEREKVKAAMSYANVEWYRNNFGKTLWDHITDAVMHFATPRPTVAQCVEVLKESGWTQVPAYVATTITPVGVGEPPLMQTSRSGEQLIAPAPEVSHGE